MRFNEKVHAFLAARYYVRLTERFASRGEAAFVHAVQYYAGQRGRAHGAAGDSRWAAVDARHVYAVWRAAHDRRGGPDPPRGYRPFPGLRIAHYGLPMARTVPGNGCLQAGAVYCRHMDEALCRGFSPDIAFQAPKNLNAHDCCVQRVVGVHYAALPDDPPMDAYKKDFNYHCGNLYWAFHEAVCAIFGAQGEAVCADVLEDFAGTYGAEMADELAAWRHTNFNVC